MHDKGTHFFPAMERVDFGRHRTKALASEVERFGRKRVFLILSRSMNINTEEIAKVAAALGANCAGLYDGVPQHTTREGVVETTHVALAVEADLIAAIGGGSVVDAAKITTLCMAHGIVDADGIDGFEVKFDQTGRVSMPTFRSPSASMIAIPPCPTASTTPATWSPIRAAT